MSFSKKILRWYGSNKRDLPWRNTRDPYKIWLSEILLQQTRVAQGLPYYHKFLSQYPSVIDLANAKEEEVLKLWQGLGYYSRARNLHATAKFVVTEYNGQFPGTYKELIKLKGVGDYTASAIASSSFNQPEPVVDGNVYRVLARYFGVDIPINSGQGIKYFKQLAREVMDAENVREYNQAIMEFGAIQCAPKRPSCEQCPLNSSCVALKENSINTLPRKQKKTTVRKRYFNYLIVLDPENKIIMEQRLGKGIWQNLFQFPLVETTAPIDIDTMNDRLQETLDIEDIRTVKELNKKEIVHKLSHQHLHTKFWLVMVGQELADGIGASEIDKYPVPVLIADAIKTLKISYF
ncbi:MAG: A/G-specific adenine glycosylase [Flavobacteriaceae bacterium]